MARSRSRLAATAPPAASTSQSDLDEMRDDLHHLERVGSRPAKTWPAMLRQGRRFEKWLDSKELSIDELRAATERDQYGKPHAPVEYVVAYLYEIAGPEMKPKTLSNYAGELLGWFRGTGWAVPSRRETGSGAELSIVSAIVANHRYDDLEAHVRVPARPTTATEWVAAISASIDASRDDQRISMLWIEAMRTFHLSTAWFGFRGGEVATKLRWGWLLDDGDQVRAHVPGGHVLKWLATPRELVVPTPGCGEGCDHPDICVVHQLRRWKQMCDDAGIPTGPNDLVLPAIRREPGRKLAANSTSGRWWKDRLWVADPVAERITETRAAGLSDDDIALAAEEAHRSHYRRYAMPWKAFATSAGFEPRHRFERVSSHGNRRGCATRMHANGASTATIAAHLCQLDDHGTVGLYIDDHDMALPDPRSLYELDLAPRPDDTSRGVHSFLDPDSDGFIEPTPCDLLHEGSRCDQPFAGFIEVNEVLHCVCVAHRRRFQEGKRGGALTRPVAKPRPLAPGCEVTPAGAMRCGGQPFVHIEVDGEYLSACGSHYSRYWRGLSGAALTAPIRQRCAQACEVAHSGVPCDRAPKGHILIGGDLITACSTHLERYRNGKRGDALTAPIAVTVRLAPNCEVTHDGAACGRDARTPQGGFIAVGGVTITACNAHYQRYRSGKRGGALTKPIRGRLAPACELLHEGVTCGREPEGFIDIDGGPVTACISHFRRYRKGLRGQALTEPIAVRGRSKRTPKASNG